jgi:signal transduction histidine kinase
MPATAPPHGGGLRPLARLGARVALIGVAPLAVVAGLLVVEDAFELGDGPFVPVLGALVGIAVVMLLIGLRDLSAAEARAKAASDRAATAEATERARADELARVLEAGESLAFTGEGQVDYLGVLQAITPDGATSFLVGVESEGEGLVVAAHGPMAASVIGFRRPLEPGEADSGPSAAPVVSFSSGGHPVGLAVPRQHFAVGEFDVESALSIRLADHGGARLGWLHMIDHRGERILEPSHVKLAQLVASQIGVAMENNALLARVRRQLVEVQRVQHQLVQASKLGAVGELAAAVAHEVNNPLTGILGFAELLANELPEDDARHEEAVVIRDEAIRARSIVRALLEFARPRPPQRIPTNLNDVARSTLELINFRAADADVRIVADYGELPCLEVDPDAFRQVLLNLFNNAIDAMPHGGELRVTTLSESERVGLVVADVGVGMNAETRERVFAPFFSTRTGVGNGLGLSVSLQIVEGHGGTIEVESTPGRGSVFTVWLPIAQPAFDGAVLVPGTEATGAGPAADSPTASCAGAEPRDGSSEVAA